MTDIQRNKQTVVEFYEINGELAKLSTNNVHRLVQGAEHQDLVRKREHGEVTMDAIQDVVQALRTGQQLPGSIIDR